MIPDFTKQGTPEAVPWWHQRAPSVSVTPVNDTKQVDPQKIVTPAQLTTYAGAHFNGDKTKAKDFLEKNGYSIQQPEVNITQLDTYANTYFNGDENKATEFLQGKGYHVQSPLPDTLQFKLYTPWGDINFDSGLEISKETTATVSGVYKGVGNLTAGIQQLIGLGESELQRQQQDFKQIQDAAEQQGVGKWYEGGKMVGFLLDPVAFAIPFARAKSLAQAGAIGAGYGAAFGGLSYVDEGETRLRNMMFGAIGGGTLTPAAVAIGKGLSGVISKEVSKKTANNILDIFEHSYNQSVATGGQPRAVASELSNTLGLTSDDLTKLASIAGRKPKLAMTPSKATELLQSVEKTPGVVSSAVDWIIPQKIQDAAKSVFGPLADNMSSFGKTVTYLMKPSIDRIRDISPPVYRRMVQNMQESFAKGHVYYGNTDNLFTGIEKQLGKEKLAQFKSLLFRADETGVLKFIKDNPVEGLGESWVKSRQMYKDIAKQMRDVGIKFTERDFYFPRIVKDKRGLFNALGKEERSILEQKIIEATKKKGSPLTELEESKIINWHVFGEPPVARNLSHAYDRKMEGVAEKFQKFYADPIEAAHTYVRNTLDEIAFRKMVKIPGEITEDSFTSAVNNFIKLHVQDQDKIKELSSLLKSVFYYSRSSSPQWVRQYKNFTHATLLGNPYAAMTQLKDFGLTATKFTVRDTISSIFNRKLGAKEWGIVDSIAEEFVGSGGTSKKIADSLMKASGMTFTDRLGKNSYINTAFTTYSRLARTPKGKQQILKEWSDVFGKDIYQVIKDLAERKLTTDTKTLVFAEVADIYPIGAVTMPQAYADNPTGRIMYTLASYQVKYLNFLHKNIMKAWTTGNKAHAINTLTKLILVYGSLGVGVDAVKNVFKGRKVAPEDLVATNMFQILGMNRYTMDKAWYSPASTMISSILPPVSQIDNLVRPAMQAINPNSEVTETSLRAAVSQIPYIGNIIANWMLGGAEEYNAKH